MEYAIEVKRLEKVDGVDTGESVVVFRQVFDAEDIDMPTIVRALNGVQRRRPAKAKKSA